MLARAITTAATILCVCGWVAADTVILDTQSDFFLAGQGVNGLQYGYYDSYQTTGTFLTTDMVPDPTLMRWEGPGGDVSPVFDPTVQHPLVDTSGTVTNSAVRRYTFGSGSEPVFTGEVIVSFQIWKTPFGSIGNGADAFITFDNTPIFYSRIPNGSTQADPYVDSSLVLNMAPGDTIDFGTTDLTRDGISDVTGFTAQITEVTPVPLPLSASTDVALLSLLAIASAVPRTRVKY